MAAKKKPAPKPSKKSAPKPIARTKGPAQKAHEAKVKAPLPPPPVLNSTGTALLAKAQSGALTADALAVQKTIRELGAQVALLNITGEQQAGVAAVMLTQLKAIRERWDRERLKLTKPLKEQAKNIEAKFKPTTEQLESFDAQLRQKYLKYRAELEAKQAEERKTLLNKAEEAAAAGDTENASSLAEESMAIESAAKTSVVDTGSVQAKKVWTFEVTDLGAVPESYKTLDDKKVNAAIRAGLRDSVDENGTLVAAAIPGIRIFAETSLAVSASGLDDGLLVNVFKPEPGDTPFVIGGDVQSLPS